MKVCTIIDIISIDKKCIYFQFFTQRIKLLKPRNTADVISITIVFDVITKWLELLNIYLMIKTYYRKSIRKE